MWLIVPSIRLTRSLMKSANTTSVFKNTPLLKQISNPKPFQLGLQMLTLYPLQTNLDGPLSMPPLRPNKPMVK